MSTKSDITKSTLPTVMAIGSLIGMVGLLGTLGSWAYTNVAGSKDVSSVASRIDRVEALAREENGVSREAIRAAEQRLQAQLDRKNEDDRVFQRQVLDHFTSLEMDVKAILRSGARKVALKEYPYFAPAAY